VTRSARSVRALAAHPATLLLNFHRASDPAGVIINSLQLMEHYYSFVDEAIETFLESLRPR